MLSPASLLVVLSLFIGWLAPARSAAERPMSAEAVQRDVALAREAYERVHPGYDRYTKREVLDAAWDAVVADAAHGMNAGQLYVRIQSVLALIRCDHTKAELGKLLAADREAYPSYLPFRWEVIDGRAFIVDPAGAEGVGARDELLAIDGEPMAALIERFSPLIPIDGFTEQVRHGELGYSAEWRGGAIEHFTLAAGPVDPVAHVRVRTTTGDVTELDLPRVGLKQWRALTTAATPNRVDFADAVHLERVGEHAAILRVDTFVNYRQPVRPDRLYDPIFAALKQERRDTLILDLRHNGGGSSDAMRRLLAHLIKRPTRLVREVRTATLDLDGLRPHLSTWDKRALKPRRIWFRANDDGTWTVRRWLTDDTWRVRPDRLAFDGRLLVLSSHANSSAVSTLLAKLQDLGRATIIGEPTGGSAEGVTANILFFLTLPESGIVTRLPAQRIYNDVSSFVPGKGVQPDIAAPRTAESLINGSDPARDAALQLADPRPTSKDSGGS